MRRWLVALLLCISATALAASLLYYAENHVTTRPDYTEIRTIPVDPVLTLNWDVADVICIQGYPCDAIAFATVRGLFPRPGVPRLAALLGGVVLAPLMVLGAVAVAVRRRWVHILSLWIAALFLFGMMLQVPAKYFSGASKADLDRQIASNAIYVTHLDAGMTCLGKKPCIKNPYYAFTRGMFPTEGVPWPLAVALGMALPGLLLAGSVVLVFRRKPNRIHA